VILRRPRLIGTGISPIEDSISICVLLIRAAQRGWIAEFRVAEIVLVQYAISILVSGKGRAASAFFRAGLARAVILIAHQAIHIRVAGQRIQFASVY
jgi:hypothetical protein